MIWTFGTNVENGDEEVNEVGGVFHCIQGGWHSEKLFLHRDVILLTQRPLKI